jgi:hypothetical protein
MIVRFVDIGRSDDHHCLNFHFIIMSKVNEMTAHRINRQTSGESASLPQYLGCNTVFDMRLRVTVFRRKTVSLQSNIAHREKVLKWRQ